MLRLFQSYIQEEQLFSREEKLLVAVSGGIDSMVLCHLLLKAKYTFAVAHCNFKLRGAEADADEALVKNFCVQEQLPFFTRHFNTTAYATAHKLSIQMAARELRYNWFTELMLEQGFDKLLTAHHLNDNIETFFINLIRGAGINGLKGILPATHRIVRPLLFTTRSNIETYASEQQVLYRNDSSNACDKYLRNKLRLNIIPKLKELNPAFEETLGDELRRMREVQTLVASVLEEEKKHCLIKEGNWTKISIEKLLQSKTPSLLLFGCLYEFGFNPPVIRNVESSLKGEPGRVFYSTNWQLTKDRNFLVLSPRKPYKQGVEPIFIEETCKEIREPLHLLLSRTTDKTLNPGKNKVCFDADLLQFPLHLARWQQGDKFMPLGMKGFKKLSDFFTNEKMSLPEKQEQWLLKNSNNDIVWVIGRRIDERYKITGRTKQVLQVEYLPG